MLIPPGYEPTYEQIKKAKFHKAMQKAKSLSDRMKMFLKDIQKSSLKQSEKTAIKNESMKFINHNSK